MGKHLARAAVRREAQRRRQAIRFVIGAGTAVVAVSGFALTANGAVLGPFQEAAVAAAPAPAAVAPAVVVAERVAAVAAAAHDRAAYRASPKDYRRGPA